MPPPDLHSPTTITQVLQMMSIMESTIIESLRDLDQKLTINIDTIRTSINNNTYTNTTFLYNTNPTSDPAASIVGAEECDQIETSSTPISGHHNGQISTNVRESHATTTPEIHHNNTNPTSDPVASIVGAAECDRVEPSPSPISVHQNGQISTNASDSHTNTTTTPLSDCFIKGVHFGHSLRTWHQ